MNPISRRQALAAGIGVTSVGSWAVLHAQPPVSPAPAVAGSGGEDPLLAACLLVTGRRQIEVCRMALSKLQSDDVKAFANAEIQEHEDLKKKLANLGCTYPVTAQANAPMNPAASEPPMPGQGGIVNPRLPEAAARMIAVNHEVVDQCLATLKAEFGRLQGVKLEKCFVGDQLYKHYDLFDHGVVFRRHASPQLAAVLDDSRKVIEQHITTCKTLMDRLDSAKSNSG